MAARAELPRAPPRAVAYPGKTASPRHRRLRSQEAPRSILRHPRNRRKAPYQKVGSELFKLDKAAPSVGVFHLSGRSLSQGSVPTKKLQANHVQKAEEALVIHIQAQHYGEELRALSRGSKLPPSSPLLRLRPTLRREMLVVPGRLCNANLPDKTKAPAVLPHQHPAV